MIIDYIDPEKLPKVVVWLDWIFFAYKQSLGVIVFLMTFYHIWETIPRQPVTISSFSTPLLISFCLWVVYCYFKYGYRMG